VTDAQISKILGTTKATIEQVRARTHWNAANIKPIDPVTLGLIGQLELDALVKKAAEKKAKDDLKKGILPEDPTLRPASEAGQFEPEVEEEEEDFRTKRGEIKAEDVFGQSSGYVDEEDED
jgi:hypothetical protein